MDFARFERQIILPEVGINGQLALKESSVLIVGAGGLGCPVATYLAAAGVSKITLVDFDTVDPSNLNRQISFGVPQIGLSKSEVLAMELSRKYPDIFVKFHTEKLGISNINNMMGDANFVIDCTDNFDTRYLVNDYCKRNHIPLIIGSLFRFEGQICIFNRNQFNNFLDGKCYRSLYPEQPSVSEVPNCNETGIIGTLAGSIGVWMAWEYLKIVLNLKEKNECHLIHYHSLNYNISVIEI